MEQKPEVNQISTKFDPFTLIGQFVVNFLLSVRNYFNNSQQYLALLKNNRTTKTQKAKEIQQDAHLAELDQKLLQTQNLKKKLNDEKAAALSRSRNLASALAPRNEIVDYNNFYVGQVTKSGKIKNIQWNQEPMGEYSVIYEEEVEQKITDPDNEFVKMGFTNCYETKTVRKGVHISNQRELVDFLASLRR